MRLNRLRNFSTFLFLLYSMTFVLLVADFGLVQLILSPWLTPKTIFIERISMLTLARQHLLIVLVSCLFAFCLAFSAGIFAVFSVGRDFRDLFLELASFAETFPTPAVIALSVPFWGYGFMPVMIALTLYSILPILRNTIIGLEQADPSAVEAAKGMGMTEFQIFTKVRLPLALPVIFAGLRVAVIVNISAATVGAAVGSGGFGVPIVNGIRSGDPVLMLRGALPVIFLALAADAAFRSIEEYYAKFSRGG